MPVQIRCPNPECGKTCSVAEDDLNRSLRCKACGQRFTAGSKANKPETYRVATEVARLGESLGAGLRTIGRFELREKLGAGAFGQVFRAWDPHLERDVALKLPRPDVLADPKVRERFWREAKAAARLHHKNIVPVYDAGKEGELYYIALEFIQGRTLETAVNQAKDKGAAFDFRRAARVIRELAEALAYAHGQGIVHRDVKPSNTMMDQQGHVHLMDFGLAQLKDAAEKLTMDGARMGTPAYMSPEQARGQKQGDVGPASDQYSLGAMLYELLCGELPFTGPPALMISLQASAEPPSPRSHRPEIPRDLETICLKAMAKRPEERYASCQELAEDLRRWLDDEPIVARPMPVWERGVRWIRRRPTVAALLVVSLLAALSLLVGGVWFLQAGEMEGLRDLAEGRRVEAEKDRDRADQQKAEADKQRAEADRQKAEVDKQRQEADRQKAEADKQRDRAERIRYAAQINLAHHAWQEGNIQFVLNTLDAERPEKTGKASLVGFEWHYLRGLCQSGLLSPEGHDRDVTSITFSPDGSRLASSSLDRTVKVWDAATGKEVLVFTGHTKAVYCVAFSPDGKRLVSGSEDDVKVWDAVTGREALSKQFYGKVSRVAFNSDGTRLIIGFPNRPVIQVLHALTGQELLTLKAHAEITSVAFSPDGKCLAAGGQHGTVHVWHAVTGQETLTLKGDKYSPVMSLAFSPDGKWLASASLLQRDKAGRHVHELKLRVTDTASGQDLLATKRHYGSGESVAFSPDCKRVASGSGDGTLRIWDLVTGRELVTLQAHVRGPRHLAYSPDGNRLATANEGAIKIWGVARALTLKGHSGHVTSMSFSPDGNRLATASTVDRQLRQVTDYAADVKIWDTATGRKLFTLQGQHAVTFSPDGKQLASTSGGTEVKVWQLDELHHAQKASSLEHLEVWALAFSANSERLVSGGASWLNVWDPATGRLIFKRDSGQVTSLAFSPDGKRLASGIKVWVPPNVSEMLDDDYGGQVKVWDAEAFHELLTLKGHNGRVTSVSFSPDGKQLASASFDKTVKLWDGFTGQEVLTLKGHTSEVGSVVFSPDGKRLATGSEDGTVKIWDAVTGQEALTLKGHTNGVTSVAFSPDGNRLASGSRDGTVRIWDATPEREAAATAEP
jgi:WD40 repeat protein/predicted Ser/Thr protein kinase